MATTSRTLVRTCAAACFTASAVLLPTAATADGLYPPPAPQVGVDQVDAEPGGAGAPAADVATRTEGALASTGASALLPLALGTSLVAGGAVAVVASRRSRRIPG